MCSRALSTAELGSGADLFRCPDEGARIIEGGDSRIGKRDVGHEEANLHAGNDALVEPNIDVVVVMHNQSTGSDSDEDRFNLAFLTSVNDHALRGRDTPKTSDCKLTGEDEHHNPCRNTLAWQLHERDECYEEIEFIGEGVEKLAQEGNCIQLSGEITIKYIQCTSGSVE